MITKLRLGSINELRDIIYSMLDIQRWTDDVSRTLEGFTAGSRAAAEDVVLSTVDHALMVDSSAGVIAVTLPIDVVNGQEFVVKLVAGANNVVVSAASGTIDGAANKTWNTLNASFRFMWDGGTYRIV